MTDSPRVPGPDWAMRRPESAGPPMSAAWNTERLSERAPGRSSGGTSRGMSAWREGPSKAAAAAPHRVQDIEEPRRLATEVRRSGETERHRGHGRLREDHDAPPVAPIRDQASQE